ncbi:MAG: hypothetical protein K2L77_00020, partial [Muribaculaceae bacterium]|nr:hypothetical protein [Muribaculaceae bacterium]
MKVTTFICRFFKIAAWTLMGAVLLLGVVLMLVYSPWSQDYLRRYVVTVMNKGDMKMDIESLKLHFPLDISVTGLALDMPGQSIAAGRLDASVRPLSLLRGHASISHADVEDGRFVIGAQDSAMYMTIDGRDISLRDADVALASMDINLGEGTIRGGRVNMTLNTDTAASDTTAAASVRMSIAVRRLVLDDFAYTMRMLPTIDSLGAVIRAGEASDIAIDLYGQTIGVRTFTGSGLDVAYIAPDSATVASAPVAAADTANAATVPWTIKIDSIGFDRSKALYTTRGVKPAQGLDFGYIEVDSLAIGVKDFYNRAATVRVPLHVSGTERCGMTIDASGTLAVDSLGTNLIGFKVRTPGGTGLFFNALIGMGNMTTEPSTPLMLHLDGEIARRDALNMFPAFATYLLPLPQNAPVKVHADVEGTAGNMTVEDISVNVNGTARLSAKGRVENVFDAAHIGGRLQLSGALLDLNRFKPILFDKKAAAEFNIPRTTFSGYAEMNSGNILGKLEARTEQGKI